MNESRQPGLIIVSGMSGGGKTVALHALEDLGFYCVDNLPPALLEPMINESSRHPDRYSGVGIGIDARAGREDLERLPALLEALPVAQQARLLFLDAEDDILIRRFSETRRRHPLLDQHSLPDAIATERQLLAGLKRRADVVIDTSKTNIHQLRRQVWRLATGRQHHRIRTIVLESFAYKRGLPSDADLVFDARCLTNPHWKPELRVHTGLEQPVRAFLDRSERVQRFRAAIAEFLVSWLPAWAEDQRSQITVAIGCTGGKHRSVYLVEWLADSLRQQGEHVLVNHRDMIR